MVKYAALQRIGYLHFGKWFQNGIDEGKYEDLHRMMKRAGFEVSLRGYLGVMTLTTIAIFITSFISTKIIALLILQLGLVDDILVIVFTIPVDIILTILTPMVFLYWPNLRISERKVLINSALPTVASYMSAMASAGVAPAPIFASLAQEDIAPEITTEAKRITRDTEILGLDILQALTAAAYRSPSDKWASFLEGINATVTSGGDLTNYLATETKVLMQFKEEEGKEFIEGLGVVAEIFMVLGVVGPLFFIVMFAIMSVINLATESLSVIILLVLTYLVIPLIMLPMLLLIETMERGE